MSAAELQPVQDPQLDTHQGQLLYVENVTVSFDGFRALNGLNLYLDEGELRCIIGPNGAGKTTMLDVITGKTRPDTGTVFFGSRIDLTRLREHEIVEAGVGRKFQRPSVFPSHSVFENLELSLRGRRGVLRTLFGRLSAADRERIQEVLATVGLAGEADTRAGQLSHGQKQWLEIGMLLAQDPAILLVDEPVAGMTDAETAETAELLRRINETHSVVVVEHDMTFVRDLDVKVTVLHEGSVLAEGSLDSVQNDQRVIEVYLGR